MSQNTKRYEKKQKMKSTTRLKKTSIDKKLSTFHFKENDNLLYDVTKWMKC